MTRQLLGPFSRVEGHLEIELERDQDQVVSARVNSPLYRGMETIMLRRQPLDALTLAPRVCGICSVSQTTAAARTLRALSNESMPRNAEFISNLVLGCEVLANHLSHFYLFFMPDFAREIYQGDNWFQQALRFKAEMGEAQGQALEARSELLQIMGILAGKWPHTLSLRPGGSTRAIDAGEVHKLGILLGRFRKFLEKTVFGTSLEIVIGLESSKELHNLAKETDGDLARFLYISQSLGLSELGQTHSILLSAGGFESEGTFFFPSGTFFEGKRAAFEGAKIHEDITHSFYNGPSLQSPVSDRVEPDLDKDMAYSWCKAPRLDGMRAEVGALARQVVKGTPVFMDCYEQHASSVENRITARLFELAELCLVMESWVAALDVKEPFYKDITLPDDGRAYGFVEAARGALGHWVEVTSGQISNYQIIAPTTWNFSPRDDQGIPGPLENALEACPLESGADDPVRVQHIVRSFDPCMACTVH